jgi:hypothetical protein
MRERIQETQLYDTTNNVMTLQPTRATAVTASDSTVLEKGLLYVGTSGDVKVKTVGGDDIVFTNVADSFILPVLVTMVYSTSTTATDIVIMR